MRIQPHAFRPADLIGGDVVLDFSNTVTARNADPVDWFDGYPRLLEWAALTDAFDRSALAELSELGATRSRAAALALGRTRSLREAVHNVVVATIRGDAVAPAALSRLEGHWKQAVAHAHLAPGDRARPVLSVGSSRLDYLRHDLALRAVELLAKLPHERTRICAGLQCGWLFLDRSKGGRRRWCDMATCGNVEKARRHYERKRAGSPSVPQTTETWPRTAGGRGDAVSVANSE